MDMDLALDGYLTVAQAVTLSVNLALDMNLAVDMNVHESVSGWC